MILSDVCLSVAYIGPKSRRENPRKTKIGTEVAHLTCDLDTTFKVKRSKVKLQGDGGILWRSPAQLVKLGRIRYQGLRITVFIFFSIWARLPPTFRWISVTVKVAESFLTEIAVYVEL